MNKGGKREEMSVGDRRRHFSLILFFYNDRNLIFYKVCKSFYTESIVVIYLNEVIKEAVISKIDRHHIIVVRLLLKSGERGRAITEFFYLP